MSKKTKENSKKTRSRFIPRIKDNVDLLKKSVVEFVEEDSFMHGAALAYYAIIALVPIIYLSITYFGLIVGQDRVIEIVTHLLESNMGITDLTPLTDLMYKYNIGKGPNKVLQIVGIIALIFTSTAMFNSLSKSLNAFFGIKNEYDYRYNSRLLDNLLKRLISFGLMAIFGIVIVVIYFFQSILIGLSAELLSDGSKLQALLYSFLEHFSILFINFIAFSFVFKFLHNGIVRWRLAMIGALFTSFMLYLGQLLINYYLSNFFFAANSGIAGTMLAILAWIFYTSQIIFLGAKVMAVYARMIDMPILPKKRREGD